MARTVVPASSLAPYIKEYQIALATFGSIRTAFPAFTMNLDLTPEHVDIAMDIPIQAGLLFDVSLNLQNRDELHLNASALWVEWFRTQRQKKHWREVDTS